MDESVYDESRWRRCRRENGDHTTGRPTAFIAQPPPEDTLPVFPPQPQAIIRPGCRRKWGVHALSNSAMGRPRLQGPRRCGLQDYTLRKFVPTEPRVAPRDPRHTVFKITLLTEQRCLTPSERKRT